MYLVPLEVRSPEAGVTNGLSHDVVAENGVQFLCKSSKSFPQWAPSPVPLHCFPGVPVLRHPSSWILSVDPFLGVLYCVKLSMVLAATVVLSEDWLAGECWVFLQTTDWLKYIIFSLPRLEENSPLIGAVWFSGKVHAFFFPSRQCFFNSGCTFKLLRDFFLEMSVPGIQLYLFMIK